MNTKQTEPKATGLPEKPDFPSVEEQAKYWKERDKHLDRTESASQWFDNKDAAVKRATVVIEEDGTIKFQSTKQPDLYFWSDAVDGSGSSFMVVAKVDGFPGTEAHDDWFGYERDANDVARMLAEGSL